MKRSVIKSAPLVIAILSSLSFGSETKTPKKLAASRLTFWKKVMSGKILAKKGLRHEGLPSSFALKLDESSFEDVVKSLGPNKVIRTGEAASSEATLCYKGDDGTTVAFSSDEMHGTSIIANVDVRSDKAEISFPNCELSQKINASLIFGSGVKIGISKQEAEKIYGAPSKRRSDYDLYRYESTFKNNALSVDKKDSYDCTDQEEILIHFKEGTVDWFAIRRNNFC